MNPKFTKINQIVFADKNNLQNRQTKLEQIVQLVKNSD